MTNCLKGNFIKFQKYVKIQDVLLKIKYISAKPEVTE